MAYARLLHSTRLLVEGALAVAAVLTGRCWAYFPRTTSMAPRSFRHRVCPNGRPPLQPHHRHRQRLQGCGNQTGCRDLAPVAPSQSFCPCMRVRRAQQHVLERGRPWRASVLFFFYFRGITNPLSALLLGVCSAVACIATRVRRGGLRVCLRCTSPGRWWLLP